MNFDICAYIEKVKYSKRKIADETLENTENTDISYLVFEHILLCTVRVLKEEESSNTHKIFSQNIIYTYLIVFILL